MFGYTTIISDNETYYPTRVCLQEMHAFDAMRFVLEQAIYYNYLYRMTEKNRGILTELHRTITNYSFDVPSILPHTEQHLDSLFMYGKDAIRAILHNDPEGSEGIHIGHYQDLFMIFNRPLISNYKHNVTLSITETFLTQWCAMALGQYNAEVYPDATLYDCAVYLPSIRMYKDIKIPDRKNDFKVFKDDPDLIKEKLCITLVPRTLHSFDLKNAMSTIFDFDMRDNSLNDIVAYMAAFSLDHDNSMNKTMSDVCYDILTGSHFVDSSSLGSGDMIQNFLESVRRHIECGKLRHFEDTDVFQKLLTMAKYPSDVINGLLDKTKPPTAASASVIRTSGLAFFVPDKPRYGLADISEGDTGDISDTDDMGSDDLSPDEPDSIDPSAEDTKPRIDPDLMLLQLAKPDEKMSDYLTRSVIAFRINAFLANPPKNALPADILMIKRWRSRWLYLASISCLKDFLSRMSVRLSDY